MRVALTLLRRAALFTSRLQSPCLRLSEELLEFFHGQARIPYDAAHSAGITRIVARDRHKSAAIRHHDVSGAFPHQGKPRFLQSSYRSKVRYARKLWHRPDRDFHFSHVRFLERVRDRPEILRDGVPNVIQCLGFGHALGPATRQSGTGGGEAFFRREQSDSVARNHFPFILRRRENNGDLLRPDLPGANRA